MKALLCKLNISHKWHVEHAEDGSLYKRCLRCGKDDDERQRGCRCGTSSPSLGTASGGRSAS
jgi:hypothetical protein